jgi:hypothetical protein
MVDITILAVPGCPHLAAVTAALAGRADVSVSTRLITDPDDAARLGMRGSPTFFINKTTVLAPPGDPGLACLSEAPSVDGLMRAIEEAANA